MPNVEISIGAGRSEEQIRTLMRAVHEAVLNTVDTRSEHIRVIVREVPRAHWATGDVTLGEMDAGQSGVRTNRPDPSATAGDTQEEEQS